MSSSAWGGWSVSAQLVEHPRFQFTRIPWLGLAILWLGPVAIKVSWPVEFSDPAESASTK